MHWDILDKSRKKLVSEFRFLKDFYLAGGTALALQLGHRTSVDFDFYSEKQFNELPFEGLVVQSLPGFKVTQRAAGTLIGQAGKVDLSFFYYPYPLIHALEKSEYFDIASIADIACMKLIAISQRGLRRDFIDLFVICQTTPLAEVFHWAKLKYPQFDPHICLKGIVYFEDAETDESGRGMALHKPVAWKKIRSYFQREAHDLARKWL